MAVVNLRGDQPLQVDALGSLESSEKRLLGVPMDSFGTVKNLFSKSDPCSFCDNAKAA